MRIYFQDSDDFDADKELEIILENADDCLYEIIHDMIGAFTKLLKAMIKRGQVEKAIKIANDYGVPSDIAEKLKNYEDLEDCRDVRESIATIITKTVFQNITNTL